MQRELRLVSCCVCSPSMLAADAAWALLPAHRPASRRRVAQEATPRTERRAPCRSSLRGWTPVVTQGGSCAALRQRQASVAARSPHPTSRFCVGADQGLDRACTRSAPAALRQPARGRVCLRVTPGGCLTCPPSFGGGSFHPSPAFPPAARSESPSAVRGACQEPPASTRPRRASNASAASRPSHAGLDAQFRVTD